MTQRGRGREREGFVPLVRAGSLLRKSYNQTLRLVQVGDLKGEQDKAGYWWVDAADLERFAVGAPDSATQPVP